MLKKFALKFGMMAVAAVFAFSISNMSWANCGEEGCGGCSASPAVAAAVEKGDFDAWKKLAVEAKCPHADKITAENFPKLVQAHKLMKEGKKDEARAIRAELGMGGEKGQGHMKGHKKGHKCHGDCADCKHKGHK